MTTSSSLRKARRSAWDAPSVAGPQDVNIAALNGSSPSVICSSSSSQAPSHRHRRSHQGGHGSLRPYPARPAADTIVDALRHSRSVLDRVTLALTIGSWCWSFWCSCSTCGTLIPHYGALRCSALWRYVPFGLAWTISPDGMTIAVGFRGRRRIVVTENIYRHVENGTPAQRAPVEGARDRLTVLGP